MAKAKAAQVLIPAVSYLRKSTKGFKTEKDGTKRERQERSIAQQREEIAKLAARLGYKIIREYADPGISGTRDDRPDFNRMVNDAKTKRDYVAILCDDVDRFSRQTWNAVQRVVDVLTDVGIKYIVTASQGTYDLVENETNLGTAIKFICDVWASNQSSRKLGRRITLKNIERANNGKRSGVIPYAMKNDGKGGLVHGGPKAVTVVKRIFKMFVDDRLPYNRIMELLNQEAISSPRGASKWSAVTVRDILTNSVYVGDFTYGRRQQGKFNVVGADGEIDDAKNVPVTPSSGRRAKHLVRDPIITRRNLYKPIVDRKMFDAAQRRVAEVSERHKKRITEKSNRYALSDILICHHCGSKMAGATPPSSGKRRYYCGLTRRFGKGACEAGTPAINEEDILPQVLELFFETRKDIYDLLTAAPDEIVNAGAQRRADNLYQIELEEVTAELKRTREKLLKIDWDAETAMMFQTEIRRLSTRQRELEDLINSDNENPQDYNEEDMQKLDEFWEQFDRSAISAPFPYGKIDGTIASFYRDPFNDDPHIRLNSLVVNEALKALGTEVRLQFNVRKVKTKRGLANRYTLKGGQYRLGQFKGKIAGVAGKAPKSFATDSM